MTFPGAPAKPVLWFDVEDLYIYALTGSRPSGIQRVTYEIHRQLVLDPAMAGRVRFLRHDPAKPQFVEVDWADVEGLFHRLTKPRSRAAVQASEPPPATPEEAAPVRTGVRAALGQHASPQLKASLGRLVGATLAALGAFLAAFRAFGPAFRSVPPIFATLPAVVKTLVAGRAGDAGPPRDEPWSGPPFAPGDVIVCLGSPWFDHRSYPERVRRAQAQRGARFAVLIHDIIPVRRPEWCDHPLVKVFESWHHAVLPMCDQIFSVSRATGQDVERYAAEHGMPLKGPVTPIFLGAGFTDLHPAAAEAGGAAPRPLVEGDYALIVSTIEARKNHMLLFRVWRRLLEELPADKVPTLVFAGKVGWLVADLMQQLKNAGHLGGKIVHIDDASDAELKGLYEGCLFTLFPSLYEGWGLPVTESLMFGKPCILSNRTSLPEAGGEFGRYFDPADLNEAYEVVRRAIEDREGLRAWEADIRARYRPRPWSAPAAVIVDSLDAALQSPPEARSA